MSHVGALALSHDIVLTLPTNQKETSQNQLYEKAEVKPVDVGEGQQARSEVLFIGSRVGRPEPARPS